jgi:riboflavin synthase
VTSLNDGILRATVNLERPLQFDGRVGGHFVQGHVDAVGRVKQIRKQGEFWWLTISYPPLIRKWLIPKGAIAVDGISLTVATMDEDRFGVQIVPFTWENTRLHAIENGAFVNLECDMVGKYAVRALEIRCDSESVKDRELGEKNGS